MIMRIFNSYLLIALMISFFLLATQQKAWAQKELPRYNFEADVAEMSEEGQREFNKLAIKTCECLSQHHEVFSTYLTELDSILEETKNNKNRPFDEMMQGTIVAQKKTADFQHCAILAGYSPKQYIIDRELSKIIDDDSDPLVKKHEMREVLNIFLKESCPNEQKTYQKFLELVRKEMALQSAVDAFYEKKGSAEELFAKMSEEAQLEWNNMSSNSCQCLRASAKELSAFSEKVTYIFQKNLTRWATLNQITDALPLIEDYELCLIMMINNMNKNLMSEDLDKIMGIYTPTAIMHKKKREITCFLLKNKCPNEYKLYLKYLEYEDKVSELYK